MINKYSFRSNEEEIMDDLSSGGELIVQTLKELETINKLLGGNQVTVSAIDQLIDRAVNQTWRIVDIGCGGGDMLKLISKWAKKREIKVELIGIDANPHVIQYAEKNCSQFSNISFQVMNIHDSEFKKIRCDILTATLFLHHFKDEELVALFSQFKEQATTGMAINDLHRHWFAYRAINVLTSLFSKSTMVKYDAGVSVLRGFSNNELKTLMRFAKITNYSLRWRWAFRWQLIIRCE